jgi:HEAT repeat protein
MLDKAIDALKTYDWGIDPQILQPISAAIVSSHGDAAARKELEERLVDVLGSGISRDARDFVCRQLKVIGTAASVPALAAMLANKEDSHMARYALESMPAKEAGQALRDALPKLQGELKAGVIGSLGVRRDSAAVAALAALIGDADDTVATSAAHALGAIRTPDAAKALSMAPSNSAAVHAAIDASLACAEALLEEGDKAGALSIYKRLSEGDQPKHVRLAATRGRLAVAGTKR